MDIKDYRQDIDRIDSELTKLFCERMEVAAKIGNYKKENGLPVFDPKREREKLNDIRQSCSEDFSEYAVSLYSLLFELSRAYQHEVVNDADFSLAHKIEDAIENTPKMFPRSASVACQGVEGAYSQLATEKLFATPNILYFSSFENVFASIEKGLCEYGVIPLENSTAGSVNKVYDLMMNYNFKIVRSVRVKVNHCLMAPKGVKLEDITEIYSHPQAISQCSEFLESLGKNVRVIPCENTAVASETVAKLGGTRAAICSKTCRDLYGLEIIKQAVQDKENNYTRFICISKDLKIFAGADRTSLMAVLPHKAGSLYKLLSRFYALGINLNKLESRPLPDRDFEFMFYFDLETSVYSPQLIRLLGELPELCEEFSYLGSYSEVV